MSNSATFNLIIPVAADKDQYDTQIPLLFTPTSDGVLLCIKSILELNLSAFDNIYFTILRKHAERYDIDQLLRIQFRRLGLDNANITILDNPTENQVETVCRTIEIEHLQGAIYIKDADCSFRADVKPSNSIAIFSLEKLNRVNPQNKSYVSVDDMQYVTNIIEKRIVSHYFCAGGYGFEDVRELCDYYSRLKNYSGQLYLSHVIYAMLLDRKIFKPVDAMNYKDFEQQL